MQCIALSPSRVRSIIAISGIAFQLNRCAFRGDFSKVMAEWTNSDQNAISRFFKPKEKKPLSNNNSNRVSNISLFSGTAEEPVPILDDDSDEGTVVETVVGVQSQHITVETQTSEQTDTQTGEEKEAISTAKENPFACFAHDPSGPTKSRIRPLQWKVSNTKCDKRAEVKQKKQKTCDYVKMKDHSVEEQERITKKWHSLVESTAPLEVRRFQVLVAARLHARCQEPTVRKAMKSLREAFSNGLSVDEVAKADPEVLALYITNLQFYNAKAKQIVKAANEIQSNFGGIVPEDEQSLLQITGVGKVFADLLGFVNTRSAHSTKAQNETVET